MSRGSIHDYTTTWDEIAMARGAFFWGGGGNFQGGDSCTFSQGFRRFSENLRWPSRDEMAGCLHGELYASSSRDKFQLGHLDRVEKSSL